MLLPQMIIFCSWVISFVRLQMGKRCNYGYCLVALNYLHKYATYYATRDPPVCSTRSLRGLTIESAGVLLVTNYTDIVEQERRYRLYHLACVIWPFQPFIRTVLCVLRFPARVTISHHYFSCSYRPLESFLVLVISLFPRLSRLWLHQVRVNSVLE